MHIDWEIVSMSLGHEPSQVWITTSSGLMFTEVSSAPPASGSYLRISVKDNDGYTDLFSLNILPLKHSSYFNCYM